MKPYRIIVTGSRNWSDETAIEEVLLDVTAHIDVRPIVIVQGGAPGADSIAKRIAERRGWRVETFEADWKKYGKAAGPRRNGDMVMAGGDICCAFPGGSRTVAPGTWNCLETAAAAGIPVRIHGRTAA